MESLVKLVSNYRKQKKERKLLLAVMAVMEVDEERAKVLILQMKGKEELEKTKSSVPHFVSNYVKVEPATKEKTEGDVLKELSEKYNLDLADVMTIHRDSADGDTDETHIVLELMKLTLLDDLTVRKQFDFFAGIYGKHLQKTEKFLKFIK